MKIPGLGALLLAAVFTHADPDPARGAGLYKNQCQMCHAQTANGIGPAHKGLFGRKAGTVAGFNYSAGLKNANIVWDEKTLTDWLAAPEKLVPGQKMNFVVANERDRADIVAYLAKQATP